MEDERPRLKRIPRDPARFDVIDLYGAMGRSSGYKIGDASSEKRFLEEVSSSLARESSNPIVLHGRQTQEMFAYIAASLGACGAIKEEDAGELIVTDIDMRQPDFRLITKDNLQFFVEVKNFRQKHPTEQFTLTAAYLLSLEKYCKLFGHDLKFAIYWSSWNMWSLISPNRFTMVGDEFQLSMGDAMKANEMALIGDSMIGTLPPLAMRLVADRDKPRSIEPSGEVAFTISGVELYCGGHKVLSRLERNLAFYLLLFGGWHEKPPHPVVNDRKLDYIEFVSEPDEATPNQEMQLLSFMSAMISRHFKEITAPDRRVTLLSPKADPGALGVVIPEDYKGEVLKLWRLHQQPS